MTATTTMERPATTTDTTQDAQRLVHRRVCAYLKGYIVGYSKRRGMKWKGNPEKTSEFAQGYEDSKRKDSEHITFAHILYNWVRHDRCHLGKEERDQNFVDEYRKQSFGSNKLIAKLADMGLDVQEVLG